MIPFLKKQQTDEMTNNSYYEYALDFETGEVKDKKVYGTEAIKVWVYKALKTKRYCYTAYTWDFGQELESLIGCGYDKGYIDSEAIRMIKDALSINSKIKRCHSFTVNIINERLQISFEIDTIFGSEGVDIIV